MRFFIKKIREDKIEETGTEEKIKVGKMEGRIKEVERKLQMKERKKRKKK